MKLSIVIPAHNEEGNLPRLLHEIGDALAGWHDYEILAVDDGSTDATLACLLSLKPALPRLRVLRHSRRRGQSTALLTGILWAKGQAIVTLDGDGQNDPADIPRLFCVWQGLQQENRPAMVTSQRTRRQDTAWRRLSSQIANAVRGRLLGDRTPDTGCGLKVFSRELFLSLPRFNHMHRFLPALALQAGAVLGSVEVGHRHRRHGVSHYGTWQRLWAGIIDLMGVMWLGHRAMLIEAEEFDPPHQPR